MYYTIVVLEDVQGKQKVELNKDGNLFVVIFSTEYTPKNKIKRFEKLEDAVDVFQKYVKAFAKGNYDYETRKSWLE